MNIAFVTAHRIWAGVKVWMLEFGGGLHRLGDGVFFYASDQRLLDEAARAGMAAERVRFGADYNPARIAYFLREFRRHRIDLAVMNIYKELRTAGIAARLLGIPVVHRVGLVGDITGRLNQRLVHRHLVTRVLVTSHALRRDILATHAFIHPGEIVTVHNGRDISGIARTHKADPVRFVITSRLEAHKGHRHLLSAFQRLNVQGCSRFTCHIYGDGKLRGEIEREIHARGLAGQVALKGFAPRLVETLGNYDFGLLTSDYESLANTVLEYLAAGLPVVATDAGGVPEMVRPGHNGLLYTYGDIDTLTAHLARCVGMAGDEYARLSAQAIAGIREHFDKTTQVRELRDFFHTLTRIGQPGA